MDAELNELEGTVTAVVFSNPENGYAVLRLSTQDGVVTAAGALPGVVPGERLALFGVWEVHQQYGEQFKAQSYTPKPPDGANEIFLYLSSGAVKDVGPARARDIVAKFGNESLHVIENDPQKLASIRGITMAKAMKIGTDYRRQTDLRRLMEFLTRYGIKPLVATRIYRDYGVTAINAVRDNPYIVTSCGAEFFEADALAFDLGFDSNCTERVSSAILFELAHNLNNGHTFIPVRKLVGATQELIGAGSEAIEDALDMLHECGDVVIETVAGEEACYLQHMFEAESYTARRILELGENRHSPDGIDELIRETERQQGIRYADMQREALKMAAESGVMALTGGPGTGKTTIVRGILMLFEALGLKTALCAPTGRAAKRLSETCHAQAATIHRLLGAAPGEEGELLFDRDEQNPLGVDAVIVDEMSMVDILLMRALLAAIPPGGRLIMVGDADQLPPVGPGGVFADVLKSGVVPSVALSEIFRQAEDSGIVRCAHSVLGGVSPDFDVKYPDLFLLKRQSEQSVAETVAQLFAQRLPKNMGLDPSQIQVLSPTRKGEGGTVRLNARLREAMNPAHASKNEKQYGEFIFRTGDKVMQIRNNYDILWTGSDGAGAGVYNGDVGTIVNIDRKGETVTVDFEDKTVDYQFEQLGELEPAFAMTVHKSQGSEYQAVILALTNAAPRLLTRGILYTAMTRAKKLLVIVGDPGILETMVQNDRRQKRYGGLRARLCGG